MSLHAALLPILLAQLEHLDLGKIAETLLGAGGSALVVGLIARQWVGDRLRELAMLKKRAAADRVWKTLAKRHMRAQARELNRASNNLHELRNFVQDLSSELEKLAEASTVRLRLPEGLDWERAQLPTELELDLGRDDEDEDLEEKETE
jgi:hypothetical protein